MKEECPMKKTSILSFLAMLLSMLFVLCGCGQGGSPAFGTVSTTTVTTATEATTSSTATAALNNHGFTTSARTGQTTQGTVQRLRGDYTVQANYAEQFDLSPYDAVMEYIDTEQWPTRLVFWTDKTVTNFSFLAVDLENPHHITTQVLYTIDELTPETPLVIQTIFPEGYPVRGIRYTDEGVEKQYAIQYNGSGFGAPVSLVAF